MTKGEPGRFGRWWRKMRPLRKDPVAVLPEEVMHMVWSLLDHKSLLSCCRVSSSWNSALANDSVWKRFCLKVDNKETIWRQRYLDERSLRYNWGHNKFFTYTKTPVNGRVEASESAIFTWEESYITALTPECTVIRTVVYKPSEKIFSVKWTGLYLAVNLGYCVEMRDEHLDLVTSVPIVGDSDVAGGSLVFLEGSNLCQVTVDRLSVKQNTIPIPECRRIENVLVAGKGILVRIIDNSFETVHTLYRSGSWSILNKIERTPLGERIFKEMTHDDFVLLVHWVYFEGVYLYSNVNIFRGAKLVSRESICNCRRDYFAACFGTGCVVFAVAEYRFALLDLESLTSREIYVKVGFQSISRVLDRFLVVIYEDKIEVLDAGKVVYTLALNKPGPIVRNTFIATTCSKLAGLKSIRVLSFRQPEYLNLS